jgi:hypothetical protein
MDMSHIIEYDPDKGEQVFKPKDGQAQKVKQEVINGLVVLTRDGVGSKDVSHSAVEKIQQEKKDELLTEKAELRQPNCWRWDCNRPANVWVREVQFDLKHADAGINYAAVSSDSYPGPVPGFCHFHLSQASEELAEVVYLDQPPMHWGFRPNRWHVVFTDGTKVGGTCEPLNLRLASSVLEDFTPGT